MQHEPRLGHVVCPDGARMAYWEWGDPDDSTTVICVHGVSRQGRDFDVLAQALQHGCRVVCPDVIGRGQSDRLADPSGYHVPRYAGDMLALIAQLKVPTVRWVGTSMGGLIGMAIASLPRTASLPKSPIARLLLNDVGPVIQPSSIARIGSYLGLPLRWKTLDEAADYLWSISQGFGPHTRAQWLALSGPMLVADAEGFRLHYDPAIANAFKGITPEILAAGERAIWAAYDAITCPTLLMRGAESDLLSRETATAMSQRGPKAIVREIAGVGHAPTLVTDEQIAIVREFILQD